MFNFHNFGLYCALLLTAFLINATMSHGKNAISSPRQIVPGVEQSASTLRINANRIVIKLRQNKSRMMNSQIDAILSDFAADQAITRIKPVVAARVKSSRQQPKIINLDFGLRRTYYVEVAGNQNPVNLVRKLQSHPQVEYAEPLYQHRLYVEPNDPKFVEQSYFGAIKAEQAWEVVKGTSDSIVIAIVDGGSDIHHPDLADNVWVNRDEIPGNKIDDDGNGFVDDINGWNFQFNRPDPTGAGGTPFSADHGTNTAGIACAVTDNGVGVAGTSWNARLMAINAADDQDDGFVKFGYEGILYAAQNGADVINLSWGRSGAASQFEQEVIAFAQSRGCAVVAAAGNDGIEAAHYPASYAGVLSVTATATDSNDVVAGFSNFGNTIDVAAPGVGILSTLDAGRYGTMGGGTSFSSPMAAGVVALVMTLHPDWLGIQASEQVRVTADNIDDKNSLRFAGKLGRGRINAARAVQDFTSPAIRISDFSLFDSGGDGFIHPGDTVEVAIRFINYLAGIDAVDVFLRSHTPLVVLQDSEGQISNLGTMQTNNAAVRMSFVVREQASEGERLDFFVDLKGDLYQDRDFFSVYVQPTFTEVNVNNIRTTFTSVGRIGFADTQNQEGGFGFVFNNSPNLLFEGAIIAGTGPQAVSNAARDVISSGLFSEDFSSVDGKIPETRTPGILSAQESFAILEDDQADSVLGIRIAQQTFAEDQPPDDDFVLVQYTVENTSQTKLDNFHFGLFFDWDIDDFRLNSCRYVAAERLGFVWRDDMYVGTRLLTDGNLHFRILDNAPSVVDLNLNEFSDAEKWQTISGGIPSREKLDRDVAFVMATGPFSLAPNETVEIGFAFLAGESETDIKTNAQAASDLWDALVVTSVARQPETATPETFALQQNYPNPFNPETRIQYTIAQAGEVELSVFNLLGQRVATLVDGVQESGSYSVTWNGLDDHGRRVASGVYVYRLVAGEQTLTRKMVMLR